MMVSPFEQFKRKSSFTAKEPGPEEVLFQLLFDDYGAYLEAVNGKGKPVAADFRQFSGPVREVLRALESIRHKNSFVIDWEKDPNRVYLADYDFLMWQLRLCSNLIDEKGRPITFQQGEGKITIRISGQEVLQAEVLLSFDDQERKELRIISEGFVMSRQTIYAIKPLGSNFGRLPVFQTAFPAPDLDKYLSLLFSAFQHLQVQYQDYQTIYKPEPLVPQPTLIFEKIDETKALYLRITQVVPDLGIDFLEQYDLGNIVQVHEMENTLVVRNIAY